MIKILRITRVQKLYWDNIIIIFIGIVKKTHGFFGILMDKLEEVSNSDDDTLDEEKLEEQWLYIMETIQNSLENGFNRLKMSWALLVAVSDTVPLPWEVTAQKLVVRELINELEFNYVMMGAVVKAGVKEIVGTLQKRVVQVIQQLEKYVDQLTKDGEDVHEMKLLHKMEQSFELMNSTDFIAKLMRRIVNRAITASIPASSQANKPPVMKVFFSPMMEQTAIVFEAYRQRGHIYAKTFWNEISVIMRKDMESSSPRDLSSFLHHLNSNNDLFVENVFAILVSAIPIAK
ncbi:uncharacterized protein LOC110851641 isoform X2 [Folsomia candida]|uniref:uncharacterized protein LOC110851641 isoform X2 n=1 Tax=Folsomia candida TaxID=158441 RepID=UPI000B909EF3|nr:uncharacterized protein LOC110851641 isoform X2 [Folsomia candida]